MSGRPRLYANAAEKTRAYRARQEQRTIPMDRISLLQLQEHLRRLIHAVNAAKSAGDPLAASLETITQLDLLADLADYFEKLASSSEPERR